MAPILLALMVFGIVAKTNAWPYPGDFPGDDEDGYDLAIPLSQLCHQAFHDNEPKYHVGFVRFMFEVICPSLLDDGGEGSGEGSGDGALMPRSGLDILTIEVIVQALSPDPATQRALMKIAENTCQAELLGHSGIDSFCKFFQEGISINGGGGGGGGGSGSGSGDGDGTGSVGDGYGDGDDGSSSSSVYFSIDQGYGFGYGSHDVSSWWD